MTAPAPMMQDGRYLHLVPNGRIDADVAMRRDRHVTRDLHAGGEVTVRIDDGVVPDKASRADRYVVADAARKAGRDVRTYSAVLSQPEVIPERGPGTHVTREPIALALRFAITLRSQPRGLHETDRDHHVEFRRRVAFDDLVPRHDRQAVQRVVMDEGAIDGEGRDAVLRLAVRW